MTSATGLAYPDVVRWVRRWDRRTGEGRILDAGAGGGAYAAALDLDRYTSFDLPSTWYGVAHPLSVHASAPALPFRDGAFSLAFAVAAFDYFPEPAVVLGELRRCLAEDGAILLFLWPRPVLERIHAECEELEASASRASHHVVDEAVLRALAAPAGLAVRRLGPSPMPSPAWLRRLLRRPVLVPYLLRPDGADGKARPGASGSLASPLVAAPDLSP